MQGMPFADDIDDLIDTLGQSLGYNTNSKLWKRRVLEESIGQAGGQFVLNGFSSLPGIPLDVQARLSVGNLIPGSATFKRSETDKTRDILEFLGPVGGLAQSFGKALGKVQEGKLVGYDSAASQFAPVAIANAMKSAEMVQYGMYRDSKGRKVIDTDAADALVKAIGFQPADVARESRHVREVQQSIAMTKVSETEIADKWAQGIFEHDPAKVAEARQQLVDWNTKNPDSRIQIVPRQIAQRVQEMMKSRTQRVTKSAPREIRAGVSKELQK
jgi:protein-disulfide isomerase-like protein with CxxC motif